MKLHIFICFMFVVFFLHILDIGPMIVMSAAKNFWEEFQKSK